MADFQEALREVEPSAIREVFVEVPNVTWDDVGGLDEVKQRLREAVQWPLKYPELFASVPPRAAQGRCCSAARPAAARRCIAKALATEAERQLHLRQGAGAAVDVRRASRSAACARSSARPARPRPASSSSTRSTPWRRPAPAAADDSGVGGRVLSQLLTELDGIEELKGVFVLAATNRPDLLDPALLRPGRFDIQLDIPLPDRAAREKIFQIHLRDRPVEPSVTPGWLADQTEGFSGAEIEGVCHRAMMAALSSRIEASPDQPDAAGLEIDRGHLQTAIQDLSPRTARVEHE